VGATTVGATIEGGATGKIGLTPALLSCVAPSGIASPSSDTSPDAPGVESGEALPGLAAVAPGGTATQPVFSGGEAEEIGDPAEMPAVPPPSKIEFESGVPIE
jgi:hypothetical protein